MWLLRILLIISSAFFILQSQAQTTIYSKKEADEQILYDKWAPDEPTSYFRSVELFDGRATFDQYIKYAMRALSQVAGFDNDLHRYDSKSDIISSFKRNLSYVDDLSNLRAVVHPTERQLLDDQSELTQLENERNQATCGEQLDLLIPELTHLLTSQTTFAESRQLALIELIDSFGSPESQLMKGNFMWFGSYKQCMNARVKLTSNPPVDSATRYCVAKFKAPTWSAKLGQVIKLGICLPEACNSISFLRHKERIEILAKTAKLNQAPYSNLQLTSLYCLPDESSPIRQFSLSAKIFLTLLISWILLVAYFSLEYEYIRFLWLLEDENDRENMDARLTNFHRILAFRLNWSKLFNSAHPTSNSSKQPKNQLHIITLKDNGQDQNRFEIKSDTSDTDSGQDSSSEHDRSLKASNMFEAIKFTNPIKGQFNYSLNEAQKKWILDRQDRNQSVAVLTVDGISQSHNYHRSASVDLSVVDGIKVLSMIWLISAHTLLFFIRTIANGRDFWSILRDPKFMTVLAGIFPVDTFFTITGVLTAYLKFNKNNGQAMTKMKYWLENFVHRYLRFMPMYLIIFWYTRDISEYIGSGPLWDYATANTSLRSVCKQESVTVPLLFQANFKPIDQHCVKPAWYLANDYQYLLITPIFMGLIMKSTYLGYLAIGLSIAASMILQFLTVFYSTEVDDFGVLINFKPMFGSYVLKNLWKLYVLPYNRLPPYLIGLVTGHLMYRLTSKHSTTQVQKEVIKKPLKVDSELTTKDTPFQSQSSLVSHINSSSDISKESKKKKNLLSINYIEALKGYLCFRVWAPLVLLISIIYSPMITKLYTQEGRIAKVGTSSIIAMLRFFWSLAIARVIYVCSTRLLRNESKNRDVSFIIRFLTSAKWKPWSKIGLSALLIQWEIIGYLAQIQTSAPEMTITFLSATILVCIVATYSLALLLYLTIEFPLSQVEQIYIHPAIFHKT